MTRSFTPRFDVDAPIPPLAGLGRVHVLAVGGAGMSAVARLLLQAGLRVSGSDQRDGAVLQALREAGATIFVGHDPAHVDGVDTIVVSSAIRADNPELMHARELGLPVLHRSQALAAAMGTQWRVAVAGANGKTTTSSMLTSALSHAGQDPSFALGGELTERATNAALGGGAAFVAEADESDGSFLVYHPDVAIVTNVQPDHLDFYGTYETVQEAYREFASTIRDGGLLVACADDPGSADLAQSARADGGRVITYGFGQDADLRLTGLDLDGLGSRATLTDGGVPRTLHLQVPGAHNLLNAAGAYAAATRGLGVDPEAILAGLGSFGGTRRRFETRGTARGVVVVDDYAHNAGKVEAVVRTAAQIAAPGKLRVIFQPHLYSRTRDFAAGFAAGLAPADQIILLDIYGAREEPIDGVSSELIAAPLRASGKAVDVLGREQAVAAVVDQARPGDLILTIGAGDVTELPAAILAALATEGR
ncbi:UDP-N-acetylmuramate--L-alanine ligase [Janibacter sp. GXQ6167]|uniref:UDP-N-acetylmuramate--L-alanine ligase n=1 Tax=Janibacter sp. GXQ6167 TaxID=3240791 RepID=UPI003526B507